MSDAQPNTENDQFRAPQELSEELRHVTAPPGPSPQWKSDESARLRETWLAFGGLLEAVAPGVIDEKALVEAVRSRHERRRRVGWLSAAAGVAAAVLITALIARPFRTRDSTAPSQVVTSQQAPLTQASTQSSPTPERPPQIAMASTQSLVQEIAWDDRMGGRLEPVRRSVRRLQAGPNRHAERMGNLRARISALQEDWSQNRL